MAAELQDSAANSKFNADLMYLGDDGKPVFMPLVDAPPKSLAFPYRPDGRIELQPVLLVPYDTRSATLLNIDYNRDSWPPEATYALNAASRAGLETAGRGPN